MATFKEYFLSDFGTTLRNHMDWTLTPHDTKLQPVVVVARSHADFDACVQYVSYFVPEEAAAAEWLLPVLVDSPLRVIDELSSSVQVISRHTAIPHPGVEAASLPFSGRVFIYVDAPVTDDQRARLHALAEERGVRLEIRDRAYFTFLVEAERPLGFISHDSGDKEALVRPLVDKLRRMMCPVWYDEYSLAAGDSLRASIDAGLRDCPRCVVVLSPAYLENRGWAAGEFNAAVTRHMNESHDVVVPVWHGVTREEVANHSPLVADIVGVDASMDLDEVARRLSVALNAPI